VCRQNFKNVKGEVSWKTKVQIGILPVDSVMLDRTYCHYIGSVYSQLLTALFSELEPDRWVCGWVDGWMDGKEEDK
jgi:hypothetical protein